MRRGSASSAPSRGMPRGTPAFRPPSAGSGRWPYTRRVQPPRFRSRPIGQDLRPDPPLVHERLSDPILVKRAKDGDARALDALCERHAPKVERLAHHLLRDREDARDAAQDALAKLCVKLPQFRGESSFSTWLHRLTVNACRDVGAAAAGAPLRAAGRGPARGARRRPGPRRRGLRAPRGARRLPGSDRAGAGEGGRAQGRVRLQLRGDRGRRGDARRHGQVLRAPRPQRPVGSRLSGMTQLAAARQGGDRGDPAAPRSVPPAGRGDRAGAERARGRAQDRDRGGLRRPLPRQPDHARREDGRGARAGRRRRRAEPGGEPRSNRALRRHRRRPLQARRAARGPADARVRPRNGARPDRAREGARDRRR